MNFKFWQSSLIFLLLFLVSCSHRAESDVAVQYTSVTLDDGISFRYPVGWDLQKGTGSSIAMLIPPEGLGGMDIKVFSNPKQESLASNADVFRKNIEAMGAKIVGSKDVYIAGKPGHEFLAVADAVYNDKKLSLTIKESWIQSGFKIFDFIISSDVETYESYGADLQDILNSVTLSTASYSAEGTSFNYAPGWLVDVRSKAPLMLVVGIPPDNPTDYVDNILIINDKSLQSLEDSVKIEESKVLRVPGNTMIESTSTTLAGLPAHKIVYSGKASTELKWMQIFSIDGDKRHTFIYTATPASYDQHLNDVLALLNSLNFTS